MGTFDKIMGGPAGTIGMGIISGLVNDQFAKASERRAMQNQERLMDIQSRNQMRLNQQAKDLALQQWKDTNYDAQRKEMEKAGLNAGLMYGMSGGGGVTAQTGSGGGAQGGSAPMQQVKGMDIQSAMQLALMKAQKENIEADTFQKMQTGKNQGTQSAVGETTIQSILQGIQNQKAQAKLTNLQSDAQEIQNGITSANAEESIKQMAMITKRMGYELTSAKARSEVDAATVGTAINMKVQELANSVLAAGLMKANTGLSYAQAQKTAEETSILFKDYLLKKRAIETGEAGQVTNEDRQDLQVKEQQVEQWFKEQKIQLEYMNFGKDVIMDAIGLLPARGIQKEAVEITRNAKGNITGSKTTNSYQK